jgi:hypothetical protein
MTDFVSPSKDKASERIPQGNPQKTPQSKSPAIQLSSGKKESAGSDSGQYKDALYDYVRDIDGNRDKILSHDEFCVVIQDQVRLYPAKNLT